jgi:uncharacterized protein (TIGR03118 family)
MTRSSPFYIVIWTSVSFGALGAGGGIAQAQFKQTNLVSDVPGLAAITDPNLVNTWGVSNLPGSPFWISNQGTSTTSLYTVTGATGVAPANLFPSPATNFAAIPTVGGGPAQGPTGQVANAAMSSFDIGTTGPAAFIFANLNGTISAWNGSNVNPSTKNAATVVATTPGALYTGLAINSAGDRLYAANGATGAIDVFNGAFSPTTVPGGFVDPTLPPGFVPFNVEDIGSKVYVSYAPAGRDAQAGAVAGMGAVAVFDESGDFLQNLVPAGGELAAPWGMAIAPAGFGAFGGDLLVGNFSFADSEINAFDATTGKFEGKIPINPGPGESPGGLWDLIFGSGGTGDPMTLYLTDGINGEADGLFAAINAEPLGAPVPEPSTWAMLLLGFGGLALFAASKRRAAIS